LVFPPLLLRGRWGAVGILLMFALLGYVRMYSVVGLGDGRRSREGWYIVGIYDWGRGVVLYERRGDGWVKLRGEDAVVLFGDRPAFPMDEVAVRGAWRGDTLRVEEAVFRRGVRWFYDKVSTLLISRTLSEDQYNFALSVLTGVRTMDWEIKRAFYETGTGHILAISGLHVGILFLFLYLLLRFLMPGRWAGVVAVAAVWAYAYAVGFLPSVVRATIMLSFFAVGSLTSRPVKPFNALALAAMFSLLFRPLWLFSPSFWLSYSAVAGLFTVRGKLGALIGAHLYSLPFALRYFGKVALLYVPLNLIIIPLMTLFMLAQLLAFVVPYPFTYSAALLYEAIEKVVVSAASLSLPPLRLNVGWEGVILYLLAVSLAILCLRRRSSL